MPVHSRLLAKTTSVCQVLQPVKSDGAEEHEAHLALGVQYVNARNATQLVIWCAEEA